MYNEFGGTLSNLALAKHRKSRAINAENPRGEKGKGGMAASDLGPSRKGSPCLNDIASGQTVTLAEIEGPGAINHIWITVDAKTTDADCFVLRDLVLRMYWDDEDEPSVESPLGDFFCCGFGRECNINSMPIAVVPSRGLNCYFQMPFRKKARITLENQHVNSIPAFFYQVDYCLYDEGLPEDIAYFHAQWRREKITQLQKDYVILDNVKGKGHYVGTYMALTTLERYWWGEGEVKFYIDGDEEYPTICGTGTEDYFGGSWSFAKQVDGKTVEQNYCTPYLGYPYYSSHDELIHNFYHNDDVMPMRGFYRWHIQDPICFDELSAEHVMDSMIIEDRHTGSIDLRQMKLLCSQLRIASNMSRQENYIVPIETADGVTGMKLSIVRGEDKKGMVDIFLEDKKCGRVAAYFEAKENSVSAMIVTDDEQTKKLFEDNITMFEAGISDGEQRVRIDVALEHDISAKESKMSDNETKKQLDGSESVQTTRLYHIAEQFIVNVQRVIAQDSL